MQTRNESFTGGQSAAFEVAAVDPDGRREVTRCRSLTAAFEFYFGAEIPADWQRIEVIEAATGERIAATDRSGNQFWR